MYVLATRGWFSAGVYAMSLASGILAIVNRECLLCQLLETVWWLSAEVYSVTYMRQIGGCLQGACTLFVT